MSKFGNLKASIILVAILIVQQITTTTNVLKVNILFSGNPSFPSIRTYEEITFTDVGWFHPDPSIANNTKRTIGAREFMEAVQAHERFRLSAWTDTTGTNETAKPTLVFLDYDACALYHYPKFGGGNGQVNADTLHGRPTGHPDLNRVCEKVDEALAQHSNALSHEDSRLVVLSCNEHLDKGIVDEHCLNKNRNMALYHKLVVGHMSAASIYVHPQYDFGLPPWPVKHVHLTDQQLKNLRTCLERPIEISFKGRPRNNFPEFFEYFDDLRQRQQHNNNSRYMFHFGFDHYAESPLEASGLKQLAPTPAEKQVHEPYYSWIMNSTFCPTPRGDNIYSVRFSEVMSAACIPIVYGDDWVLPYNSEIVQDWHSMVVIIPQSEANTTLDVIRNISHEQRCAMQNNVLEFYNNYVKDSHGRLRAILALMDARLNNGLVNITHIPRERNGWV